MSGDVVRAANVYFLPASAPSATPTPPSPWQRLRARVKGQVWRVRFAMAGFRMAFRRDRTPLFAEPDMMAAFTERGAELIDRRPRLTPARIIDFGSARRRLRPVAITH